MCGLNCGADVSAARPAAFAGFVFVTVSPRHVTLNEAAPLAGLARSQGMLPVGVFRDAAMRRGCRPPPHRSIFMRCSCMAAKIETISRRFGPNCRPGARYGRRSASEASRRSVAAATVCCSTMAKGVAAAAFDWSLIRDHAELPTSVVAGGIGPHNARAAQALGAYAIDVGSAVDASPGMKSPEKIAALFEALRPSARERLRACA